MNLCDSVNYLKTSEHRGNQKNHNGWNTKPQTKSTVSLSSYCLICSDLLYELQHNCMTSVIYIKIHMSANRKQLTQSKVPLVDLSCQLTRKQLRQPHLDSGSSYNCSAVTQCHLGNRQIHYCDKLHQYYISLYHISVLLLLVTTVLANFINHIKQVWPNVLF